MELLRELDCKGVLDRASRRLKRRRYSSKVSEINYPVPFMSYLIYRVQTMYGILMGMISLKHLVFQFMDVSMGK